ncbi:hypothetical protein [Actinomadura oligospora]|uniref:hypothetical protein n=1 Tax=Actinomadura oligospora TaxID=111804 RepID=UPI0012F87390|nr:hypothetical protein [Actinomadura oligospora]
MNRRVLPVLAAGVLVAVGGPVGVAAAAPLSTQAAAVRTAPEGISVDQCVMGGGRVQPAFIGWVCIGGYYNGRTVDL